MKRLSYLLVASLALALASCSSSDAPKEIKPTSTEFTSGELAKLIEVVDEPCQISYAEKDGAIATQFIKLKVKIRLTKESPNLQKIDARDIDFTGLLSVATINLVDEDETQIQELSVKSEDLLKLKKLLQGKKGDEETITFQGEFHNHDDAPKWFEEAAAFTPYLTGEVVADDDLSSSFDIDGAHDMRGAVDKYPITMHLEIDGSMVKGVYYYDKQGPNATLKLSGTNEDGILDMNETNAEGVPTGHFKGKLYNGVFKGVFFTTDGKKMPVEVSEDGAIGGDFSYESDDLFEDVYQPTIEVILPASLRGYVEIVSAEKSIDSDDYPVMDITFKLLRRMNTSSLCSSYGQMWIVGHAQDKNGSNINDLNPKKNTSREWRTQDSDGKMFKEFLEGNPGETISLQFTGENNIELFEKDQSKIDRGRAMTREGMEKLAKFKLSITN